MGAIRFLLGGVRVCITGAAPEDCLNALARQGVDFWNVERMDALHYRVELPPRDVKNAEFAAKKAFCTLNIEERSGVWVWFKKSLHRPVLTFGLLAAVFLLFYLQDFVWVIEVEGCENVRKETVLHALEEMNIAVGTSTDEIAYKQVRHSLLRLVPELSWAAVNRTGSRLSVLVSERQEAASAAPPYRSADLIAVRDAVLTEVEVLEGMRLCAVGQTVRQGQVLVSGIEDYGLYLRTVCAQGEIYGQTWHAQTIVTSATVHIKSYTGRQWKRVSLCIGRKRINLFGNSGNLGATCDKIESSTELCIAGVALPVRIVTEEYREYETHAAEKTAQDAQSSLRDAFLRMTEAEMVAGTVKQVTDRLQTDGSVYVLRSEATCTEMLARLRAIDAINEGENP